MEKRKRGRPKAFYEKPESTTIRSLDRAMHVLSTVSASGGMTLSEVCDTSGETAPTVYRILSTLRLHAIVDYDEANQTWHVGAGAFRIGSAFLRRTQLVEQSRPVMERIMQRIGETANLAIIDKSEVVFVSQVETHEPIRAFFRPGTRGPVHASGIGKAILAYMPSAQRSEILGQAELDRYTPNTITERAEIERHLDWCKATGWSLDDEERTLGMRCIAAPIFNHDGQPVAGVSVSGPTVRMLKDAYQEWGRIIREAADEITMAIGGTLPPLNATESGKG
ncbi:MAG: IclR family transcriptional regulator [Nitratireductor sp.]|nr:IclR family transcriptional regulator [Nitratireductor sp.]